MTHIQIVYLILYIVFGIVFAAGITLLFGAAPWTNTIQAEDCLKLIGQVCVVIGAIIGAIVFASSLLKVEMQVDYYQGLLKERTEYENKIAGVPNSFSRIVYTTA